MAEKSGKAGYVDTASAVGGIKSWTIDYTVDSLETTDFADGGTKSFVTGCTGWSGTFEGYKDGTVQTIGTSSITLKLYEDATYYWTGTAYITGIHASTANDGIALVNYDYQGTGAVTAPLG